MDKDSFINSIVAFSELVDCFADWDAWRPEGQHMVSPGGRKLKRETWERMKAKSEQKAPKAQPEKINKATREEKQRMKEIQKQVNRKVEGPVIDISESQRKGYIDILDKYTSEYFYNFGPNKKPVKPFGDEDKISPARLKIFERELEKTLGADEYWQRGMGYSFEKIYYDAGVPAGLSPIQFRSAMKKLAAEGKIYLGEKRGPVDQLKRPDLATADGVAIYYYAFPVLPKPKPSAIERAWAKLKRFLNS